MANELQIPQPSGSTLYFVAINQQGQWWNQSTPAYETFNALHWSNYVITLVEAVANSGIYFGSVPTGLPLGLALLSLYVQAGSSPASTDSQGQDGSQTRPIVYVLDWSGSAVNSITPWLSNTPPQFQLPAQQDSLLKAQNRLNAWLAAYDALTTTGVASINVDGQQIMLRDPDQVLKQIEFWRNRVMILSGKRRRASSIRMDRF